MQFGSNVRNGWKAAVRPRKPRACRCEYLLGQGDRFERQYVLKDWLDSITHFDRKYPLDAARENVARQLCQRQGGQRLHGGKVGAVIPPRRPR